MKKVLFIFCIAQLSIAGIAALLIDFYAFEIGSLWTGFALGLSAIIACVEKEKTVHFGSAIGIGIGLGLCLALVGGFGAGSSMFAIYSFLGSILGSIVGCLYPVSFQKKHISNPISFKTVG